MSDHLEPDWLPEGVSQAPTSSSPPSYGGGEEEGTPSVGHLKWTREFWDEPDDAGLELVRCGMLIHSQINTLEGHYEQGKTVVLVDLARQWIQNHGPVLHLDFEMGQRRVRKRLKANQWTPEHLDRWHYAYAPALPDGKLAMMGEVLGPDLLVTLDSYSQAMMMMGLEENSATEAGGWWGRELQAAREAGVTIAVIDQVKQSASSSSAYGGRGTGAKSFGTDVKWFVERFEKFSPTQRGLVRLTLKKDREGVLPERLGFVVGDGKGALTLEPTDPPRGEPTDPALLEAVLDAFEGAAARAHDGWLSKNEVDAECSGWGTNKVGTALEYHIERGSLECKQAAETPHTRGGGMRFRLND